MKDRKLFVDFDINRINKKDPINSEIIITDTKFNDEYYLKEVKLEQYIETYDTKLGNYSLFLLYVQTNRGSILMKFDEGYRGFNSFELILELVRRYEGFSSIINRAIIELESF
jgi:hypothetical protein